MLPCLFPDDDSSLSLGDAVMSTTAIAAINMDGRRHRIWRHPKNQKQASGQAFTLTAGDR